MVDQTRENGDDEVDVMECTCKKTEEALDCASCLYYGCLDLESEILSDVARSLETRFERYRNDRFRKHLFKDKRSA